MRHAAVLVDTDGDHQIVPLDDDVSDMMDISVNCRLIGCEILPILAELLSFCPTSVFHKPVQRT
jgi:hypothetical protein